MPELIASHDHARHPEKHDVRACHQRIGRVIIADVGVSGILEAVEHRDGPQPRRKPSVQHVFILAQVLSRKIRVSNPEHFHGFGFGPGYHEIAGFIVPRRNALPPPQLAADAPVVYVFHPVAVHIPELVRVEPDGVVQHVFQRGFGQSVHFQPPLQRHFRFHHRIGVAFRVADIAPVFLGFFQQSGGFQILGYFTAHHKAVFAGVFGHATFVVQRTVVVQNINYGQVVFFAQFIVVQVVGGRYLEAARAKIHGHIFVGNDRDLAVGERNQRHSAVQMPVPPIIWVHANGRIRQNRFGAGSSDDNFGVRGLPVSKDTIFRNDLIPDIIQLGLHLLVHHFFV